MSSSSPSRSFRLAGTAAALGAAAALAACSSSGGAPADRPSTSAPTSSAVTTPPSAPATVTTTVTPPRPSSTVPDGAGGGGNAATSTDRSSSNGYCAESQLRASIDTRHIPGNGTPDSSGRARKGVNVLFLNKSSSSCVLYGYPGVDTVNSNGTTRAHATRSLNSPLLGNVKLARVTLAPGQSAQALIDGVDMQEHGAAQAGCATTTPRILVTPPNTRIPVPFTVKWGYCYSLLVHPVTANR